MTNEITGWEEAYRKRPSGSYEPHQDAESLDRLFRQHNVRRILDLGCGDGRHLVHFARRGYEMFGLDYAPTAIRLAEEWLEREGLSAELIDCDMSAVPWPEDFFDAVLCVQVINHHCIKGIRRTISEIYRVLRAGGWLFLAVGTRRPSNPAARGMCVEVEPNTYVRLEGHEKGVPHHHFDMQEMKEEFSRFGIVDLHPDRRNYTCMLAQKPRRDHPDVAGGR